MCELKSVLIAAALNLAFGFCINQVNSEKKVGHNSHLPCGTQSENPCEKEYRGYYLNGGECYYLIDDDIVGCICTWLHGVKRCEKYMWWDKVSI